MLADYSRELEREYNNLDEFINSSNNGELAVEEFLNLKTEIFDWDYSNAIEEEKEQVVNEMKQEDETYANLLNKHTKQFMI